MRTEFGGMRSDLNALGNAMVGIGNTMKVTADQQAAAMQDVLTARQKQAAALAAMGNSRKTAPRTSRVGRSADEDDGMDIDEGALADDEECAIPVSPRKSKKLKLRGPPGQQDPKRKQFVVRSEFEEVAGI